MASMWLRKVEMYMSERLQFGNGQLLHVQRLSQHLLRQAACAPQFVQWYFCKHGFRFVVRLRALEVSCRHAAVQTC